MRNRYKLGDRVVQVDVLSREPLQVTLIDDDGQTEVGLPGILTEGEGRVLLGDRYVPYFVTTGKGGTWVTLAGHTRFFEKAKKHGGQDVGHGGFGAPMPGKVIKVSVKDGETVTKGTVLVIMEAMKMEHRIEAPADGVVTAVHVTEEQLVEQDFQMLDFEPAASE